MKSREQALAIAKKVRSELEELYHERLREVYLFGSCARDEATDNSDLDMAVVLDQVPSLFAEAERTAQMGSQISLAEDTLVNFLFLPQEDFQSGKYAVCRAIRREGLVV